jgi:hypothetical protein
MASRTSSFFSLEKDSTCSHDGDIDDNSALDDDDDDDDDDDSDCDNDDDSHDDDDSDYKVVDDASDGGGLHSTCIDPLSSRLMLTSPYVSINVCTVLPFGPIVIIIISYH